MKKRAATVNLKRSGHPCIINVIIMLGLALGVYAASHSDLQVISGIFKKFDKSYNRIHYYVDMRVVKKTVNKRASTPPSPPPPKEVINSTKEPKENRKLPISEIFLPNQIEDQPSEDPTEEFFFEDE